MSGMILKDWQLMKRIEMLTNRIPNLCSCLCLSKLRISSSESVWKKGSVYFKFRTYYVLHFSSITYKTVAFRRKRSLFQAQNGFCFMYLCILSSCVISDFQREAAWSTLLTTYNIVCKCFSFMFYLSTTGLKTLLRSSVFTTL